MVVIPSIHKPLENLHFVENKKVEEIDLKFYKTLNETKGKKKVKHNWNVRM